MKVGVHFAGYSLTERPEGAMHYTGGLKRGSQQDWEHVVWGSGCLLGRIPMGIWLARHLKADFIIWSTGASWYENGLKEAKVMYLEADQRYHRLLKEFPHRFNTRTWGHPDTYQNWLAKISVFDVVSNNTSQSMAEAERLITEKYRSERVMLYYVTSANHEPRVVRDTLTAFNVGTRDSPVMHRITLAAVSAETCYGHSTVDKTKVDDLGKTLFSRKEWEDSLSRTELEEILARKSA